MRFFGSTAPSQPDNTLPDLVRDVRELRRELDGLERRLEAVDLHARAIVEEAKRMINKFERRLDREAAPPASPEEKASQDAPGRAIAQSPSLHHPAIRRNY